MLIILKNNAKFYVAQFIVQGISLSLSLSLSLMNIISTRPTMVNLLIILSSPENCQRLKNARDLKGLASSET